MKTEFFGTTTDNESIQRFTLSGGGLTARFINWGAVLQDLRFEGDSKSLVLGLEKLEDYIRHSRYFGSGSPCLEHEQDIQEHHHIFLQNT